MVYRNKSNMDLLLPGIGRCKAGGTIETDKKIENVNFEEVNPTAAPSQPANQPASQPK